MKQGDRVIIQGNTDELWIKAYHTRVNSYGNIVETPKQHDKKVLVCIDGIGGDMHVTATVRRSKIRMA